MASFSISDIAAIAFALLGLLVLAALIWWLIPRLVEKVLKFIDSVVLLDVMGYQRKVSLALVLMVVPVVSVVLLMLGRMGVDTSVAQPAFQTMVARVTRWIDIEIVHFILLALMAMAAVWFFNRAAPIIIRLSIRSRRSATMRPSELEKRVATLEGVVKGTITALIGMLLLIAILMEIRVPVVPLLASAGIVGIAVGFGAQSLIRDVIAGVFILLKISTELATWSPSAAPRDWWKTLTSAAPCCGTWTIFNITSPTG